VSTGEKKKNLITAINFYALTLEDSLRIESKAVKTPRSQIETAVAPASGPVNNSSLT